jgi:hypothetical protein
MDRETAERIVRSAIQKATYKTSYHNLDQTLEDVGLITDNHRHIFRLNVVRGAGELGYQVDLADIPGDADATLLNAVSALAGYPTKGNTI